MHTVVMDTDSIAQMKKLRSVRIALPSHQPISVRLGQKERWPMLVCGGLEAGLFKCPLRVGLLQILSGDWVCRWERGRHSWGRQVNEDSKPIWLLKPLALVLSRHLCTSAKSWAFSSPIQSWKEQSSIPWDQGHKLSSWIHESGWCHWELGLREGSKGD